MTTPSPLTKLAIRHLNEGRRAMARAVSECAAKLNPLDVGALNVLGMIEFRNGNYARGVEILIDAMNKSQGEEKERIGSNVKRCVNYINHVIFDHLKKNEIPECIGAINASIMIDKYNWLPFQAINFIVNYKNSGNIFDDFCAHLAGLRWQRFEQTFAQAYEDGEIIRLLEQRPNAGTREKGIYVDIGAHHPFYLSVTAALHFLGWNGISIDPLPGAMDLFRAARPDDVNLSCAIGRADGEAYMTVKDDPTLSFVSDDRDPAGETAGTVQEITVPVRRLDSILDEYLPAGRSIDVMNVDVEGGEDSVIESNDWARYRPYILLLEDPLPLTGGEAGRKWQRMEALGYAFACQTGHTALYVDTAARRL